MKSQVSQQNIKKLPGKPGVYFFLGKNTEILYIGKAISLKNRVQSYFANNLADSRSPLILEMVQKIKKIDYRETDSALEALILEAALIKKHQPKYNTAEKDDKSFNWIVIVKEEFPRVLIARQKDIDFKNSTLLFPKDKTLKLLAFFGPFPQGQLLKEAVKIIRKIFPFRDKCLPCVEAVSPVDKKCKPCFMRQISLCPGVCSGEIDIKTYSQTIKNIKLFLSGQKKKLIKELEKQMRSLAEEKKFEDAQIIKNKIFALNHIQEVALLNRDYSGGGIIDDTDQKNKFRIESYDIAHIMGTYVVGVMIVILNGQFQKSEYRKFKIKVNPGINDTGALKEVISRRLNHSEWLLPNLIVVDGSTAQKNVAEKILNEKTLKIPVVAVTKDDRHKQKEIIGETEIIEKHKQEILRSNLEAHRSAITYHRSLRDKIQ